MCSHGESCIQTTSGKHAISCAYYLLHHCVVRIIKNVFKSNTWHINKTNTILDILKQVWNNTVRKSTTWSGMATICLEWPQMMALLSLCNGWCSLTFQTQLSVEKICIILNSCMYSRMSIQFSKRAKWWQPRFKSYTVFSAAKT